MRVWITLNSNLYTLQNYPHMLYIQSLLEIQAQLPLIDYSLILVNIAEENNSTPWKWQFSP